MRTLVCIKPGLFEYKQAQKPALKSNHTLLKIKRIGVCGTDLHAYEGTQPFFNYPRILGHELAAEIEDVDGEGDFEKGERVTIIPYFNCGHCIACRNGKPNCCAAMNVCGVHVDGGMSEYLLVHSYSLVKSEGLSFDELALIEPFAIGVHGVRRANVQAGDFVLIIGAGPIGMATMVFAKNEGATVIAMDINEARLSFCREKLNIEHAVNAADHATEYLKTITKGDMPAVIIDATGNLKAIHNAFQWLAHSGRFVLIGLQKEDICVNHPEFHKREATLMSSRNATRSDFSHVIASIKNGLFKPSALITHRVKFQDVKNNFEDWLNPDKGVIKAMIEMD